MDRLLNAEPVIKNKEETSGQVLRSVVSLTSSQNIKISRSKIHYFSDPLAKTSHQLGLYIINLSIPVAEPTHTKLSEQTKVLMYEAEHKRFYTQCH